MTKNDKRVAKLLILFFLAILCVAELLLILWGGRGYWSQDQRVGLLLLSFALFIYLLVFRIK